MEILQLLNKSEELTDWIHSVVNNLAIEQHDRYILSYGCLDLAREYREGIVLLITNKLYGPAFALVRSVFESYIRGVWLHRCAKECHIKAFKNDKLKKSFNDLVQDIENLGEFGDSVLLNLKNQSWNLMNSFTHSGLQHVLRRIKTDTLEPSYHDAEIEGVLNCTNALGLLAVLQIAAISTNQDLPMIILKKTEDFMSS